MSDRLWDQIALGTGRVGRRPDLTVVLPELLIGEYPMPADACWLGETYGVSAVLSLQDDADLACKGLFASELAAAYGAAKIRFERLPVGDGNVEELAARLDEAVALLARLIAEGGAVYLHCNAGMNRAPTVAIAYLHVHRDQTLQAARDHVKSRRACVPYWRLLERRYGQD